MGEDKIRVLNIMIENNLKFALALVRKGKPAEAKDYIDSCRGLLWELIENDEVTRTISKETLDELLKDKVS